MSFPARKMDPATATWLGMFTLTLCTWGWGGLGFSGAALVLPALLIVLVKGQLLIDHFMEARAAHRFWRLLLGGYLLVVTAGIGIAFLV